ncbi:hypothetical protein L1987_46872 [Smallanthus sonchifolius]|uniref:Uncharacterized protein n=1 Tax=Smallanthus sonchifolius TaxID=185202 RepID=A0ACB9G212_9ASTR|nr:hypothetical protein L1987_46872 [Smallanthus sonchifolius]
MESMKRRPPLFCSNIKKPSEIEVSILHKEFTMEEIKDAAFECGDDKAPGPDSFNFRFIKRYWHLFASDLFRIMQSFYDRGEIQCGCGSSFIALIPKTADPVKLNDYRPINLVGVISKLISKVLASRIKKVIYSVVSDTQSAFLSDRSILDGPLMVNE